MAQARSANLGLVLAHQDSTQVDPRLLGTIHANTGTKMWFGLPHADAVRAAREFGGTVKPEDLMNLARHHAIARIATSEGSSAPVTIKTQLPRVTGNKQKAIAFSRGEYGRPREDVEREINSRQAGRLEPKVEPPLSGPDNF